jgi:hypothetical protein
LETRDSYKYKNFIEDLKQARRPNLKGLKSINRYYEEAASPGEVTERKSRNKKIQEIKRAY